MRTGEYNKAVIKKTDHHKSDVENKKWGARTGGLRVSGRFNPEPDLDNANVGIANASLGDAPAHPLFVWPFSGDNTRRNRREDDGTSHSGQ